MGKKQSNPPPPVGVGVRPAPPPAPPAIGGKVACMLVREMEERLAMILRLLDEGFDPEGLSYDMQAVNQAHRVAAGGVMPREVVRGDGNDNEVF